MNSNVIEFPELVEDQLCLKNSYCDDYLIDEIRKMKQRLAKKRNRIKTLRILQIHGMVS